MILAVTVAAMVLWPLTDLSVNFWMQFQGQPTSSGNMTSPVNMTSSSNVTSASGSPSLPLALVDIARPLLDFKVLGGVRVALMTLWTVSTLCARRKAATKRQTGLFYVILMTMLLTWMYNGAKLLMASEEPDVLADRFHQLCFGWTAFASLVTAVVVPWSRRALQVNYAETSRGAGLEDDGEGQPLLQKTSCPKDDSEKSSPLSGRTSALLELMKISIPDIPYIFVGLCFLLCTVTCSLMVPLFTGQLIDTLLDDPSRFTSAAILTRLAVTYASRVVSTWVHLWMFRMYVARVTLRLRHVLFAAVMSQNVDFFDQHETGELVSRFLTDVAVIGDSLSPHLELFLKEFFTAVGAMGLMVQTSWHFTVLAVTILPAFVAITFRYGILMKMIGMSSQQMMANIGDQATEKIANIRTVRSFAMEDREVDRVLALLIELFGNGRLEAWMHSTFQALAMLVHSGLEVSALVYGCHIVQRHFLSGGDVVTVIMYLSTINASVQIMNCVYASMLKGLGSSQVVFELICSREPQQGGAVFKEDFKGLIQFRDVSFSYPSRPGRAALSNMSFTVEPGEVVALVGPSGGGKSTCVSLLQNLYQPSSGGVLLDGVPVHRYQHGCLHSNMALVGQEPVLFSTSLRNNVAYGLESWTDDEVISAAKQANAHDFISLMPDGYNTMAGENGAQVSGGQKQRIAIARALIRQPAVLLLDEATSALDSSSEALVQEALLRSTEGRTVLIIAHRLSTVERADRVLVIHRGHVVEEGTPSELLYRGGMFTALAQTQLLRTPADVFSSLPPVASPGEATPTPEDEAVDELDEDYCSVETKL